MSAEPDSIYRILRKAYGRQGWWPIVNNTTGKSEYGIKAPRDEADIFEIAMGAILTQNVAWVNVEKAIFNLKKKGILHPAKLYKTSHEDIAVSIIPSGYYNQKAIKIKHFLAWFKEYNFSFAEVQCLKTVDLRKELLGVKGIGPETADSILLYGLKRKIFVVDAYTKRVYSRLGLINPGDSYESVQLFFQKGCSGGVEKYSEYHALIVVHGKDICRNKPKCGSCCLGGACPSINSFI